MNSSKESHDQDLSTSQRIYVLPGCDDSRNNRDIGICQRVQMTKSGSSYRNQSRPGGPGEQSESCGTRRGGYFVRGFGFELFEQLLRLRFGRQRHCSLYGGFEERHRERVERQEPRLMLTCLE